MPETLPTVGAAALEERSWEVAGVRVAGRASQGGGRPLVYLHGLYDCGWWSPFLGRLATERRVLAPELPGFGRSGWPDWWERMNDVALGCTELLAQVSPAAPVDLVGHSLGGWLAAALTVAAPERVRRLVLVDPLGAAPPPPGAVDSFLIPDEALPRWLFARPERVALPPQDPAASVRNRTTAARLGWSPRNHDPQLGRWLYRVTAPTLVVRGAADAIAPEATAEPYLRGIAGARPETVADAAHCPHLEHPERCAELVLAHLGGA